MVCCGCCGEEGHPMHREGEPAKRELIQYGGRRENPTRNYILITCTGILTGRREIPPVRCDLKNGWGMVESKASGVPGGLKGGRRWTVNSFVTERKGESAG